MFKLTKAVSMPKLRTIFTSEKGAFDLTSTMVGVVIIGILGLITMASVSIVVPWFQERAANDAFSAIKIAETSARQDTQAYTDYDTLLSARYLSIPPKTKVCISLNPTKTEYEIYAKTDRDVIYQYQSTTDQVVDVTKTMTTFPCIL